MSLQLVANVIVLAAIYALVSTGYVLIYRVSRVLNLAHGELMMIGAYFLVATSSLFSGNPMVAIALAALCGLAMGIVVYAVLMRWMTGEAVLAAVLITIALGILLRGLAVLVWTTQQFYPGATLGWHNPSVRIAPGVQISAASIAIVIVTVAVYLGLFVFLQFTRWGVRMRAAGQNPLLAEQRGIRLHGVYALPGASRPSPRRSPACFGAGFRRRVDDGDHRAEGVSGGFGRRPRQPDRRADRRVDRAAAEIAAIQYVNPLLSDVVPFLVLLVVLAIRPWGLFGSREQLDRV